ncbi:NUDIX hydrolase [Streptomyces sp. BE303]|uniref:NUDIX hydrolase n=1 Tax=Streptomyces sp. BE303 TaxID=3002528 RepID=UPI002E76C1D7|nr:NUDIX hydrolase [Streptomyces sp. BE303]MED7950423.1 NUDIX hydrolase [Streptomyces sp. BE303]
MTASARREGIEHFGVGVVVRDRFGRVLLIRRATHDDLPGLWEYPGGVLEGDGDIEAGVARALAEATGLTGQQLEFARTLDYTDHNGPLVRQFVFTTVVPDGTTAVLSGDHDGQQWARPDALPHTGDEQHEVITWLAGRLATPGWRPVGGHLTTIARPATYGSFLVTDPAGRILQMRSAAATAVWDFPGGMVEHGESPFDAAVREAREELGLDLAAENPQVLRRRLVSVVHTQADADYPVPVVGHVFDGGTLTAEQQARIRLDPAEHTEFRFETAHDWRHHMDLGHYQRLRQVLRAHRCGRPLYLQRPAPAGDDFEGVLVLVTDAAGRLLMHLRDTGPGPWPGYWTPIGGWREGDESAEESAVREVREEAGIGIDATGLRTLPDPHPGLGLPLTRVLHAAWNGSEDDLVLGDEGQALRLVPAADVLGLHVPPYLQHYLPLLAGSQPEGVRP